MEKMKIEIWSDIACPYCYIGKHRLESALAQFAHAGEVELVWHSYELNPQLQKTPLNKSAYQFIGEQYGMTEDEQRKNMEPIVSQGKALGLDYNFDKQLITNTSDALRLVKLAKKYNLANEAEEVLFKAYFTDGKDVSDRATLMELGVSIGISGDEIGKLLDGDDFLSEIKKDITYGEESMNLQYIPFYLFNNKDIIQGSLAVEEYLEVLNKSYAYWKVHGIATDRGDSISGQACSIDGTCSI